MSTSLGTEPESRGAPRHPGVADGSPNFEAPPGPLHVEVTEYTRTNVGPQRMPGELPPTSGYTYAVELGIPAARAVGIQNVEFNQDIVLYVDNFTGSPNGGPVPLGYYNRERGVWEAKPSGQIVRIVGSDLYGRAKISLSANGTEVGEGVLAAMCLEAHDFCPEELAVLGNHVEGSEFWRTKMRHFSPWDLNWGFSPPVGAVPPPNPSPRDEELEEQTERCGSIIGCESQTLGEELPIAGTPFKIHYQSERMPGFQHRVAFTLTDASVLPPSLIRAHIQIKVAGRHFEYIRPTPLSANEMFTWSWDGLDAYGRRASLGAYPATIRVGFEYPGSLTRQTPTFGDMPGEIIAGNRDARTVILWREIDVHFVHRDPSGFGLGGWSVNAQHILDYSRTPTLHQGDGDRRVIGDPDKFLNGVVETVAGGGSIHAPKENVPANQVSISQPRDVVQTPDGNIYIAESVNPAIRRVDANGIITTIAGLRRPSSPYLDPIADGPALHANVSPYKMVVGPDENIYFIQYVIGTSNLRTVWRLTLGAVPTLQKVAGNGSASPNGRNCPEGCGDGGDARNAYLNYVLDIAIAKDGALFIADYGSNHTVRRVGPEGNISTYMKVPGAPSAKGIALRDDGVLFVRDSNWKLLQLNPTGESPTVVVSNILNWCPNNGGGHIGQVDAFSDGSFLVDCFGNIRRHSPDGTLLRVAGSEATGDGGDNGPALRSQFRRIYGHFVGSRGDLFIADNLNDRVRRVRSPIAPSTMGVLRAMSRDGAQVFEFNADGKHLRTRSASTGTTLHTFGYDPTSKLLTSITDRDGNVTSVTRAPGTITITAPGGQETVLTLDGNGYLASVQNPVTAEITQLTHSASGLLTDLVDPRGFAHHFDYAPDGRLRKDTNATPGSLGTRLAASSDANGWTVDLLSPENRLTRHRVDRSGPSIGDAIIEHRVVTAGGLSSVIDQLIDGSKNTISPDGTKVTVLNTAADPRWGVAASFESEVEINVGATPNVRTMTRTEERTASLAIPGDPFSVSAQTIKTTRTGGGLPNAETTRVFSAGPPAKWVTTTPAGRQIEEILDAKERVTQVSILGTSPVELYPRQFHYNDVAPPLGHVDQSTWGARTIGIEHDPLTGWVKKVTAPENLGVEFKARDNNGRPTRVELPGGLELQTLYDLGGNIVSVTPPTRPAHAFSFDPNSRLASYAPPDLVPALSPKNTLYTYDHDGLLTGLLHPNAPVHTTYDALGRASLVTGAVTTSYGYAPQGQLQTIATSDGVTTTNTWNGALLAAQTTSGPFTQTLQKTYDNFFRVSSWNIDGTPAIPITRDGDDFITGVAGMTVTRSLNYLLTKTSVGTVDDDFTYNRYGEALTHTTSGVSGGYSASYARDNAGRLLSKSETIDSVTHTHDYHYDPAGRLWKVHVDGSQTPTRTFTYDDNGNRSGGTYDDQDRLVAFGGFAYEYGNNGDLKKKIDTSTSAETVYTYDARGNLRTVVRPSPAVPATIEYLIDGLNRRIGKKEDNVFVQGFVYDGPRIVAELDATGNVKSRFVYATVGHSPDLMLSGGNTYRFVKDHLGSPRLVVRSDTGAIAQRIDYDEWGIVTADSAPGFQPFGFAGGLYDPDTKLVRFGARDYDPPTGRWTSKEPLGFAGSLNFYAYVDNDPVNWIDPTGLDRSWVILVFGPWGALLDSSQIFDRSFIDAGRDIPDGGSNGPGDAYRHCLASCRVAERYGAAFSHAVGEANEIRGDWAHDQTKAERDMDSHNNACGRSYAGSGECEQKCKNGLSNGDLRTLEPGFSKQSYWDKPNGFTLIPVP